MVLPPMVIPSTPYAVMLFMYNLPTTGLFINNIMQKYRYGFLCPYPRVHALHFTTLQPTPKKLLKSAFACAHPLMEAAGDIVLAWMLLWRASVAQTRLDSKEAEFYAGKPMAARFFIQTLLPVALGKLNAILYEHNPAVTMDQASF